LILKFVVPIGFRTLKSLWRHFEKEGKNVAEMWDRIEEIVIKTLIAAEDPITASAHCLPTRYNGYELFGFDIILDSQLKPWLLEVNISPSLHSSSPLDLAVKGPLITEVFNIAGFHLPPKYSRLIKVKLSLHFCVT
jgi:tubulin polyglutamylase TTLL4